MRLKVLILGTFIPVLMRSWYKHLWKEFVELKNIDAKFYASDYYDVNMNKYGVKCVC